MAAIAVRGGGDIIAASGEDGGLRWWDASSGRLLGSTVVNDAALVLSMAPVLLPGGLFRRAGQGAKGLRGQLASFRDGRTMLATSDAGGTVRLWDPATRAMVADLYRHPGRRVTSLTAVDDPDPARRGTDLVALSGDLLVDVWPSASLHGELSTMAPADKLAAAGHRSIFGGCPSPGRVGYDRPILLADRNGTVSAWKTHGSRLCDPLPPDPAHRVVTGIAAVPGPDDGFTVVTASRADASLRAWQPLRNAAALLPLGIQPRCLTAAGRFLVIGHDHGALALSLGIE